MNTDTYRTFRTFNDYGLAQEMATTLAKHQVDCRIENTSLPFDISFANNQVNHEYRIKLKSEDFQRANEVLIEEASEQLDEVEPDHYLFGFSDEELIQLISKRDEWSDYDFLLAQRILKERGRVLKDAELAGMEEKRLQELNEYEKINPGWLYAGFLFALLGGVFGIIMGWFISTNTKTLPNGKKRYCYAEADRKKGMTMLIIGILVLVLCLILRISEQL
ncbi:hypothetical protein [Pedobacter caeni]|uniref:Signal transducing protein n=1 Tax=Pedobacter caeni TaxID=288992 RepID=A0A1M4V9B3_9SPHI|nr:hypothetical protein [Pedobacter caeni]SHE65535.1 hypothetical protein SAMN04488522_101826 [Pedobacter caeni]